MKKITCGLVSLICVFSTQVQAEGLKASMKECAQQMDSLKRLVCYDELTQSIDLSIASQNDEANFESDTSESVVSTSAKGVSPAPAKADEIFGAERVYAKKKQVEEVRFKVQSVSKNARGKLKITFENGQVWLQKDSASYAKYSQGDIAVIKRGVFDSFYMKKEHSNRTIRVKRLK